MAVVLEMAERMAVVPPLAIRPFGPVMTQMYGQTEASTALTAMLPADYAEIIKDLSLEHRLRSCGRPTPFARVEIMDENGNILGPVRHRTGHMGPSCGAGLCRSRRS